MSNILFSIIFKEMLCLGSQSRPVWGLMVHIIGARIGPRQLPLLHPLLSALIPPPQIISTHCWPGKSQRENLPLLSNLGDFPSTIQRQGSQKNHSNKAQAVCLICLDETAFIHVDIQGLGFLSGKHIQEFLYNPANNSAVKCETSDVDFKA